MTAEANGARPLHERVHDEMMETVDEELEMEIDDDRLAGLLEHVIDKPLPETIDRRTYFKELFRLQGELVKLQDWVVHQSSRSSSCSKAAMPPARAA